MFWCCVCFYKKINNSEKKSPIKPKNSMWIYLTYMLLFQWVIFAFLMAIVCSFFEKRQKKKKVQFQLLCEIQAMRSAILCKLLVILFLLRFIIKTASHTGSCYGDFQQERALSGCLTGKPVIISLNWESGPACFALTHIQMWPIFL